ncbi:hypothetical protein pipiens_019544 [Culex pipiens pipiens]|uniref:Uncharacterized protein n=1 Tax=Culex pipiens pipiens TaxID=38569 RepID=A0ABD1DXL3_CULPP
MAPIPIGQIGKPPSVPPMAANPSVVINTPSSTPAQPASDSHSRTHRPGQARRHRPNPHHSVQVVLIEYGICAAPASTFSPIIRPPRLSKSPNPLRVRQIGRLRPRARDPAESPVKSRTRNSKDGIIVPYNMPSPEFENETEDSASKVASANGIETEDLLLEIPKIDQELAEKLSTGETSVDKLTTMAAAPPVKRGRKKKVTEPASPEKQVPKAGGHQTHC